VATKRKRGRSTSSRKLTAAERRAVAAGKRRAQEALSQRETQRETQRTRRPRVMDAQLLASPRVVIRAAAVSALGAPPRSGILIAEGDSWFDYPMHDILEMLEDEHDFDVESVAHHGDRIESMAYADGQLNDFTRRLEKVLRRGDVPRAILLSGGGNDIAGDEFGMLLNHAASPIGGWNDDVVAGVIDERIKTAYFAIIAAITAIATKYLREPLPIIVHGYAHPVPDGRGFLGGAWLLPGPWLDPGFREKGFGDLPTNTKLMAQLIDRFNTMVQSVSAAFAHVHYVDLRPLLRSDSNYKRDWANELHPTTAGFRAIADLFATEIAGLP
jgi:lysophospholipase L1-like esterase